MSRLDAAIIMEELSAGCTSTAAFILDPQHGVVDDRPLRQRRAAQAGCCRRWTTMEKNSRSYCLTEARGAGSDAASLKTKAAERTEITMC